MTRSYSLIPELWTATDGSPTAGEPFTRLDIQYQLLHDIFHDGNFLFSAPLNADGTQDPPLTFGQLYLATIVSSARINPNLKARLVENPEFALNFCKTALLINIGRANTTLAFYPTMKTVARTYNSLPALQGDELSKTDLQDVPRIKHVLKGCMLAWEWPRQRQPLNLKEIAAAAVGSIFLCGTTGATC